MPKVIPFNLVQNTQPNLPLSVPEPKLLVWSLPVKIIDVKAAFVDRECHTIVFLKRKLSSDRTNKLGDAVIK